MSNNGEDCFCDAMKYAFLIILVLVVFFLGYSLIYYSNMSYSEKLSSGFGFVSSLGILSTIIIYVLQKNDSEKKDKIKGYKIVKNAKKRISSISKDFMYKLYYIEDLQNFINKKYNENDHSYHHVIYELKTSFIGDKYILSFTLKKNLDYKVYTGNANFIKTNKVDDRVDFIFDGYSEIIKEVSSIYKQISLIDQDFAEKLNDLLIKLTMASTLFYNLIYQSYKDDILLVEKACHSLIKNGNDKYTTKKDKTLKKLADYSIVYDLIE